MENTEVKRQIFEHNNWLNGTVDYRDGDLMAMENARTDTPSIRPVKSMTEAFETLKNWDTSYIRLDNIVFLQDWRYACFVYVLPNTESYAEHFTMSAMDYESFEKRVTELMEGK